MVQRTMTQWESRAPILKFRDMGLAELHIRLVQVFYFFVMFW